MDVVIDGRIKGAFEGWDCGRGFVLDSGFHKRWKQVITSTGRKRSCCVMAETSTCRLTEWKTLLR
jgi:hypothetical protein